MISKAAAIEAIKLIRKMLRPTFGFFQNKRKGHRDLKWDYLDCKEAAKVSRALKRLGIAHIHRVHSSATMWSDSHSQIRLEVPLDFSLTLVEGRKRKKHKLSPRAQFAKCKRDLIRRANALRFGVHGHTRALNSALSAFTDWT